jgi:exodeoxyribonuclease-3
MKKSLVISTWNINGLRASFAQGLKQYLENESPDILCLQETRISAPDIPQNIKDFLQEHGYNAHFCEAQKKGYSGVAVIYKKDIPLKITNGLGVLEYDNEGRCQIIEHPNFYLFNSYFPNGQRDHNRVPFKLEYSEFLVKKALKLQAKKEVLICGDLNTSHQEIDLANPKSNQKTTGFLPHERKWVDDFLARGFNDVFRIHFPKLKEQYTWWTYRNDCRERNIGWRLDYFFATKNILKDIKEVKHRQDIMGSDHCPVNIRINC